MNAILIPQFVQDTSSLRPTEVPKPQPKPDQCLIKITHCSPQHADILHAQGKHQNNNPKKGWCHPPFILGYDFAGIIELLPSSGSSNHDLKKGERVFGAGIGAFAEYIAVKPEQLRRIPTKLSSEVACAVSGGAVSYASVVHVAKVQPGETVLVSGASGGLGSMCCMVTKAVGAKVIALAGDETKAEKMRNDMDVDAVIVADDADGEGGGKWVDKVNKSTSGEGVDVVLDNAGLVNASIRCLAYKGRVVILGFAARKGVMESVKMNKLLLKSATVIGYRFGESGRRDPDELKRIWEGYLGMLESGRLKAMLYGDYRGLESVGRALGDLHGRRVTGKVVVKVAEEDVEGRARL